MRYRIIGDGSHIDLRSGGEPRTSGVHLSGVIKEIARIMGVLDTDNDVLDEDGQVVFDLPSTLRMSTGLAWEEWVSRHYPDVAYHPGEIECDGVLMTPDGIHPDGILYEFKATWKSYNKLLTQGWFDKAFWMWRAQNMGYLYGVQQSMGVGWTTCRQCVLYLNGDYRCGHPVYVELEVDYTQEEIDANWALILQHKHRAVPEKHN